MYHPPHQPPTPSGQGNPGGLGRREFLRLTGAGSLGLLALGWPAWSVAAAAETAGEFELSGSGLTLRGGQPGVIILDQPGGSPVALAPLGTAEVRQTGRATPAGPATARTLSWRDARGYEYSWTLSRLQPSAGVTVQMTFTNHSAQAVGLREFQLAQASASVAKTGGQPADWWVSRLDSYNFPEGGFISPARSLAQNGEFKYVDALTLYTDYGRQGVLMGAVGPAVADVFFRGTVADGALGVVIASAMTDVIVDPGETRVSEEVLILAAPCNPALDVLMHWIAATHGHRTARGPVFGWCSWYHYTSHLTQAQALDFVQAAKALRDHFAFQVIQLDDGWQKAYGHWTADPAKFPGGMKPVADAIRAAGALPGIWLCPVRFAKKGAAPTPPAETQDLPRSGPSGEFLDSTHPRVQAFIRQILADRVAEGYQYFKLDFNKVFPSGRHNQKLTRLQIHRELFQLYREAIGESAYLLACVGSVTRGPIGYVDAQRVGTDSCPRWGKENTGTNIYDCILSLGATAATNGVLFANDPDVTYLKPRWTITENELRTWHSFVGLLGGAAMISEPLQQTVFQAPEQLRKLAILHPPAPDKGRSFSGAVEPHHRQFGFIAQRPWGKFASVLLWNPADRPADLALRGVPLADLGGSFHIWSFWDEQYLGTRDESFYAPAVPSHAPALLRLTPVAAEAPVLIGSTLHIAMGSAELKQVVAHPDGMTMALTDAGARDGALYVFHARPLRLRSAHGCAVTLEAATDQVWRLKITGRLHDQNQTIALTVDV